MLDAAKEYQSLTHDEETKDQINCNSHGAAAMQDSLGGNAKTMKTVNQPGLLITDATATQDGKPEVKHPDYTAADQARHLEVIR